MEKFKILGLLREKIAQVCRVLFIHFLLIFENLLKLYNLLPYVNIVTHTDLYLTSHVSNLSFTISLYTLNYTGIDFLFRSSYLISKLCFLKQILRVICLALLSNTVAVYIFIFHRLLSVCLGTSVLLHGKLPYFTITPQNVCEQMDIHESFYHPFLMHLGWN